ncbi:universal stress protein [Streptomyces sp. NPDC058964]|uniref:universal stress protein n=1 Tax=Streptomyces sp. NPDC058964 TaxID=3346681 RepID=UPI0036B24857
MSRTVTVGVDGSNESLAAAEWAAREAVMHEVALRVVHAGEQQPYSYIPFAAEPVPPPGADRTAHLLAEAQTRLAHRHSGLLVRADRIAGQPVPALVAAAREAELLVLGSRGLGRVAGVLLGSVASAVVARAQRPVVLVRASDGESLGAGPYRDVVLGLDLSDPDDRVLDFAFNAASRRGAGLRVVHGWSAPTPTIAGAAGVAGSTRQNEPSADVRHGPADVLRPWKEKFPAVEVLEEAAIGDAGAHLVDVSRGASLLVVGRRHRAGALGSHIGPVTHTVLRHAAAPVAVVPHD